MAQKEVAEAPPKIVRVYHNAPGKQVFLGSIWMRDVPGAMARVATELGKLKLNLVGSSSSSINGSGVAEWGFFAIGENGPLTPEQLREKVESMPDVIRSEFREGRKGLVVDSMHYPLYLNTRQQAMIIRRDTFAEMFRSLRKTFGSGGRVVIHQLGVTTGLNVAKDLVDKLGREVVADSHMQLAELMQALGWGRLEVVEGSQGPVKAVLRLHDSFECSGPESDGHTSDFMRGYFEGYVKTFFGVSVTCLETKCVGKGNEYCEFVVEEPPALTA